MSVLREDSQTPEPDCLFLRKENNLHEIPVIWKNYKIWCAAIFKIYNMYKRGDESLSTI